MKLLILLVSLLLPLTLDAVDCDSMSEKPATFIDEELEKYNIITE